MPVPAAAPAHALAQSALNPVAHQGLWEAFLMLPPQLDAAIIAGGISLLVAVPTWLIGVRGLAVAKANKEVTEQKLFADLLKPRMEWRESFKTAVKTRKEEIFGAQLNILNPYTNPAMVGLQDCRTEAYSLFDTTVTVLVNDTVAELEKQAQAQAAITKGTRSGHSAGDLKVDFFTTDQLLSDVVRSLKPFLYVGHLKQTRKEARATPRISGLFRS